MGDWVLVVEDQHVDALVMESSVQQVGGVAVRQADSMAQARAILSKDRPVLVLLDLALPDGDGLQLLAWMREHGMRDVPVLIVSSSGDARRRAATRAAGAAEHIVKPLDLEAMEEVVRRGVARWLKPLAAPTD